MTRTQSVRGSIGCGFLTLLAPALLLIVILAVTLLNVGGIKAWEYTNANDFCVNGCHDVHPEEPAAFRDSPHASVNCVECHTGRVDALQAIARKATHFKDLPAVLLNTYGRPVRSETLRPAKETCERCHYPPAFHASKVRDIRRYQPDERNTMERTVIVLKTGNGQQGIHWHVQNKVEYIAGDDGKQEIRWVRSRRPDGQTVVFQDASKPLTASELAGAKVRTMDCVDCHNRSGHPFPSPDRAIDRALSEQRISPELPFIKRDLLAILSNHYLSQKSAVQRVASFETQYRDAYPEAATGLPQAVAQAAQAARELVTGVVFADRNTSWRSFPDNAGHAEFPGCFRCHDGKHISASGESIPLNCNLCHGIPVVLGANDPPPAIPVLSVAEPASHLAPAWMADHRFEANAQCGDCHGTVKSGTDNTSFCSNSACHGRTWPEVKLDAAAPHPIALEGGHANVWCHDCHNGVRKPDSACKSCHQPPTSAGPHFGDDCAQCHTTAGFKTATLTREQHPVKLTGAHAAVACERCHVPGQPKPAYVCKNCHQPPTSHHGDDCAQCHTPDGFKGATVPAALHPIKLTGAHAKTACDQCHVPGQPKPAYVCKNCHQPPKAPHYGDDCAQCHTPDGFKGAVVSAALHPIKLVGAHPKAACDQCHVTGQPKPAYVCKNCHQPPDPAHFGDDCRKCHGTTTFKGATLSPDAHPVKLTGAHAAAVCDECHVPGQPKPAYVCKNCHQPPDQPHFGDDCTQCHTPDGFKGAILPAALHPVKLIGAHARTACDQCHVPGQPKPAYVCKNCHQPPDQPHFGDDCKKCHGADTFKGARLPNHPVKLTGAHAKTACDQCHVPGQPKPAYVCRNCHQPPDPPHFGDDCQKCHGADTFKGARLPNHSVKLIGAHAKTACDQCHVPGQPKPAYVCRNCHQPPDPPHFGDDCQKCHGADTFKGARLPDHPVKLIGAHAKTACDQCHVPGQPKPAYICRNCHQPPDSPHFGDDCQKCHGADTFKGARLPDHPVKLTGAHTNLACDRCHTPGQPKPAYVCRNCHQPPDSPHFGDDCQKCHTTDGFKGARPPEHPVKLTGAHTNLACDRCHAPGQPKPAYVCRNCHQPPDSPHFGDDCQKCHNTDGFKGARLPEHPVKLTGAHAKLACDRCHVAGRPKPSYVCSNCHRPPGDDHTGNRSCQNCHSPDRGWDHEGGGGD